MVAYLAEEFAGRQVERDVRLSIGVHHDDVVLTGLRVEPVTGIGHDGMHVRLVEVEVAMRDIQDVGVDLNPRDLHAGPVRRRVLPRRGAAGQAEDRDVVGPDLRSLSRSERVGHHHVVPGPSGRQALRVVDRVHGLALVEDQLGLRPVAHDLDVVIGGLLFVHELANLGRLDARGQKDPGDDHGRGKRCVQLPARPQSRDRDPDQGETEAFQSRPRAVGRDEPEDREERAEDAARGRQRVHATGCVAARLDVAQQEPDRKGAHAAEQHDRRREQQHDRQQRPRDEADAQLLETLLRYEQDRVADERDDADPQARPSGDLVQHLFARMPVGEPPADDVAGGQIDEDETDQHAPDVEARPEVRREQPRGAELDPQ